MLRAARLARAPRRSTSRRDLDAYRDYIAALARRVHRRQGPERPAPQRLVQRPQRDLPGRRAPGRDPGHRLRRLLPTGEGLFAFSDVDEAAAALEAVASDYRRHSRAASEIAREYFDAERVMLRILDELGVTSRTAGRSSA